MPPLIRCALVLLVAAPLVAADTWPQWRGPTRDGIVAGPTWPNTLKGKALEPAWTVELGEGYPGPIVSADRVFVVETKGRKEEVVRALDRKTGKQVWEHAWTGVMTVPFFAARNGSWVRATPALDGDSLFVAGMRDVLVCLDANTGKPRWSADLMARYKTPLPAFGFVCSPLVDESGVYVQAAASFLKLNRKTGETIWRSLIDEGGMWGSAFSSPFKATLAGTPQVLVQTRKKLSGVDPGTGRELWSRPIKGERGMNILTPTVHDGGVFVSAYNAPTQLFTLKNDGKELRAEEAWTLGGDAYMTSPVVVNGHAYLLLRNQRLTCVDLKEGKTRWTTPRGFGQYWSMVAQGDRILALDQRGILYLFRANPEKFELLDERKVSTQETWAHLAVCGDEVYVRGLKSLTKFRWTTPKP